MPEASVGGERHRDRRAVRAATSTPMPLQAIDSAGGVVSAAVIWIVWLSVVVLPALSVAIARTVVVALTVNGAGVRACPTTPDRCRSSCSGSRGCPRHRRPRATPRPAPCRRSLAHAVPLHAIDSVGGVVSAAVTCDRPRQRGRVARVVGRDRAHGRGRAHGERRRVHGPGGRRIAAVHRVADLPDAREVPARERHRDRRAVRVRRARRRRCTRSRPRRRRIGRRALASASTACTRPS